MALVLTVMGGKLLWCLMTVIEKLLLLTGLSLSMGRCLILSMSYSMVLSLRAWCLILSMRYGYYLNELEIIWI